MNYESIANGEKRIFPYYKGKFLGVTDLGYANKKSAQKFMTQIPDADVYEKLRQACCRWTQFKIHAA